ncbi:hypothetical protein Aduo_013342 [Ancylostoma duodenale]
MAYSAEASTQSVPDCKNELGSKAIQHHYIREKLAVGVIVAKNQIQGPVYTCEVEKRAYEFVRTTGPSHMIGKNVVYEQGTGKLNLNKVLRKWNGELKNMGNKDKFGCNLSISGEGYKAVCVFE